ncbi:MAG: TonB family protein [Pirellulaceae bacterium]
MTSHESPRSQEAACIHINTAVASRRRSRLIAALLGVALGGLGAHRFYLGYRRIALLQLALTICTLGVAGLWGVAEGWLILLGRFAHDAQGAALAHGSGAQVLAASVGSLTVHAATALGAVWLSHHYGPTLMPPPSGVDSVALALSVPSASAAPAPMQIDVSLQPPTQVELEPLPELDATDVTEATLLEPPRSEPSDGTMEAEALSGPGPLPLEPSQAESSRANVGEPSSDIPKSASPTTEEVDAPQLAKTKVPVTPTAAEATAASPASAASMASQENRGFDTDALPSKVEFPQPVYPADLRRRGVTGLVKLRVRVGIDGKVRAASIYRGSGHAAFDEAALDVIRRWRFEPARQAGVPVEMEIAVPIRFVIDKPK